MAMIVGRNAKVAISSNGSSWSDIGRVTSASLSLSDDLADATSNDSGGYKESLYADTQGTLDFSFKYEDGDTGQDALYLAKNTKATYYFRFRPQESSGENQWVFQGNIEDLSFDTETSTVGEASCTVQSTGTITKSDQ